MNAIELCERGLVPDFLARAGMRRLIRQRLRHERRRSSPATQAAWLTRLREAPIAIHTQSANEQHYEVPSDFFVRHLGPQLKYSCCFYPRGTESLAEAEEAMFELYAERAQLYNGQRVLDLGCGWGSLSLWLARRFPASTIVGLSNSSSQREFILDRARMLGLTNLRIVTGNVADFEFDERFDRVLSIEMFEHMRNYRLLLQRIGRWLAPRGLLFVHVFAHQTLSYPFEEQDESDWMTKYFFRGGLMPSRDLLSNFQDDLTLVRHWWSLGTDYARTANQWLARLDANRNEIAEVFERSYGPEEGSRWIQRWRMFYMAVAELFAYADGEEWGVGHYLFEPRRQAG
jgi:cyclopropane-fatty-acyl-phospholipid synthase